MDRKAEERLVGASVRLQQELGTLGRRVGRTGRVRRQYHRDLLFGAVADHGAAEAMSQDFGSYLDRRYPVLTADRGGSVGAGGASVLVFGARMRVGWRRRLGRDGRVIRDASGRAVWDRV
jgi:hypothetical protein